ncbi:hypothetical protein ACR9MD_01175 [Helicobacter pylori]
MVAISGTGYFLTLRNANATLALLVAIERHANRTANFSNKKTIFKSFQSLFYSLNVFNSFKCF